jgi:hypothetical protein
MSALERVEIPGEAALCDDEMTRLAAWSRHHSPASPLLVSLGGRWVPQPNRQVPRTGVELTRRSDGPADNESARQEAVRDRKLLVTSASLQRAMSIE